MAVFWGERNKGYTVMSNYHLRNRELSLKAKGLFSQMISLPEDWDDTLLLRFENPLDFSPIILYHKKANQYSVLKEGGSMPQVLKDEVFERIFQAGVDVFYEKDYRSAKMQEIADKAGIPVSLIYNYHKNKEELFDKIASSLRINFDKIAAEEEQAAGLPSEKYRDVAEDYILDLLENHKIFVILMDKSQGTKYEYAKDQLIHSIEQHIHRQLDKKTHVSYNDMLCHILASNFAEGILEVARHYKDREFAHTMLSLVTKCYYEGVNSL